MQQGCSMGTFLPVANGPNNTIQIGLSKKLVNLSMKELHYTNHRHCCFIYPTNYPHLQLPLVSKTRLLIIPGDVTRPVTAT